jgi:hypothetical protein
MRIKDLPEPYKTLALHRSDEEEDDGRLSPAFSWRATREGWEFWDAVCEGEMPTIPEASLKEINWQVLSQKDPSTCYKKALPTDSQERKQFPVYSGCIAYFPNALAQVAHLSYLGNLKHHPDKPLHWDQDKSTDEKDCEMRHMIDALQAATHEEMVTELASKAWRSLADLERYLTGKCTYTQTKDK